jgi:hypothetical protein
MLLNCTVLHGQQNIKCFVFLLVRCSHFGFTTDAVFNISADIFQLWRCESVVAEPSSNRSAPNAGHTQRHIMKTPFYLIAI